MDNIWSFYESMPTVTRIYITACVLTTLGVQLDIISPFQLYFNLKLIFSQYQYWRLITTFLYFGTFGFSFMFNILFTYRYCRMLEEGSFRSNTADFFFMFLFGGSVMICIAPFVKLLFLGHAFTLFLVYVWAKRNVQIQLSLFGLFNFRAPHLPWVLLFFSLILGNSVLTDVLGIAVGHIYYYLEDVFPYLPGGFRVLKTPKILVYLFNPAEYSLNRLNEENLARPETENLNTLNQATNQATNQSTNNQTEESNTLNTTINRTEETANQINNETNNNNSINRDNQSNLNKERIGSNNLNSNLDNTTNQNNQTQPNNQHDHLD